MIKSNYKTDTGSLKSVLGSMYNKYEFQLSELNNPPSGLSAVDLRTYKMGKVQEIALDLANDFVTLSHYKLENSTDYFSKMIDPVITALRETRQSLSMYLTAEKF